MGDPPASTVAGFAAVVRSLASGLDVISLIGQVVDNLPGPVAIVDVRDDFRIVYSNPVHTASVPAERLPLVGRPLRHAYDAAEENGLLEAARTATATGQPAHLHDLSSGDGAGAAGEPIVWDCDVHPLPSGDGAVDHLLLVFNDVSAEFAARRWVRTLLDTTYAIWGTQSREELPLVAVEQGRLLIPGVDVGIGLRSPGSPGRMQYVASSVPELRALMGREIVLAEDGLGWTALTTGRPVESTVAGTSYERLRRAGIDTMRLLPLLTGMGTVAEPEPMGLLGFFRRGDVPFSDAERRLMDEFAKRLSLSLHRAQLLDSANRMAKRLQLGVETAIDLGSALDRGLVIHRLVQRACAAVDADRCTLGRIEGERFVPEEAFDVAGYPSGMRAELRIADHDALLAALLRQRPAREHGFNVATVPPEVAPAFTGVRHVAAAPLVLESRLEAMLVVYRRREPAFDEDDLATLWQIASVAVLTLRNARLLEEARAANLAKSRFMNMAAHELRTPLAAINGYVSMLADGTFGPLDEPLRGPVDVLMAKAAELAMLIEDILTASRLETGQLRAVPTRIDAVQVAARATARARTRLDLRAGRLRERLPAEPVWAHADAQHVERVLELLIDNAIKYAGGPPDVTVSVAGETDAVLRVADAGIGIEPALHELVFERFYRIDDPSAGWFPPGAGLGLAICRELAGLMGGSVVLERSATGEGSVFALRLPAAD